MVSVARVNNGPFIVAREVPSTSLAPQKNHHSLLFLLRIHLLLFLLVPAVPSVHAWGELGHQVIADLAQDMLTPKAKAQAAALLGPPSGGGSGGPGFRLSAISTWADGIKGLRPETRPWHYVTLQLADPGYAARRLGQAALPPPDSPNVVTALRASRKTLSDPKADRYAREEALKWLVHLVGDLHQPLHVGEDRDKGGNLHKVKVGRRTHNLHAVWDYVLLDRLNLAADSLRAALAREIAADPGFLDRNSRGTEEDWVDETHARTRACYLFRGQPLRKGIAQSLDRTYLRPATLASLHQLKLAAVRLAREINLALDPAAPPVPPAPARVPSGWKADTSAWFASADADPVGHEAGPRQSAGPDGAAPAASGAARTASRRDSGGSAAKGGFAWSASGKVHHLADCADVARIKPANLRRGDNPPPETRLHKGCPRRG